MLVVMPHPDDETLACGGTIARAGEHGGAVYVMVVSAGDLRHYGNGQQEISGETRAAELEQATGCLGVSGHTVVYRDTEKHMRLDAVPRRELIGQIERESELAIDQIRPDVVILPASSYNQDHEAVFRAGFAACRPHLSSDKHFVPVVLSADAPQLGWCTEPQQFGVYVDISGPYLKRKLQAYACHRSQLRPDPHHASLESVERLARLRGSQVAVEAAEAFVCHRFLL
jgi:LmbE family N-acetylglucosaminyl deacetylase